MQYRSREKEFRSGQRTKSHECYGYRAETSFLAFHPSSITMNDPKSRTPDELLSAYLDGELSPAEQEQIDHALANDPSLEGLLTELRQVRADLQLLPQHKLPSSFSDRVLQSCSKQDAGSSAGPRISLRTRHRRLVATLLAIAATVMIAAWATGPARWGGPAIPRQVATNDTAISAARPDLDAVPLGSNLVEAESDVRLRSRSGVLEKAPLAESLAESLPRDSLEAAKGGIAGFNEGVAAPTQLGRRPYISQSESAAAAEQPTEADAVALVARVELTFPIEKIEQIKAQLQGTETKQLGLKVTDLLRTPNESLYARSIRHSASPLRKEETNEEVISSRGLNETQLEIQGADRDEAVRPDALFFAYENAQPEALLLVEGTQEQIAAAVRQLNVVSTNISDLTAKQLALISPPGGGGGGIGLRSEIQDRTEGPAQVDRQARSRRALGHLGDALPSQQMANEPAVEDARLAEVADKSKDDADISRTDLAAAALTDQTGTPSFSRKSASASARAKGASTSREQQSRELEEVTGATPTYQVLFVLFREQSK